MQIAEYFSTLSKCLVLNISLFYVSIVTSKTKQNLPCKLYVLSHWMTEERLVLFVEIGQICGKGHVYGGALVMACVMHIVLFIKYGLRGKILDIFKSMYSSVKSRVKFSNN